jgi:murein DD-endopeptidase MepM/ murein hydrolase activator NlpD
VLSLFSAIPSITQAATLQIYPGNVTQGEPIMITLSATTTISKAYVENSAGTEKTPIYFTTYKGIPTALYGVDINATTGTSTVIVNMKADSNSNTSGATTSLTGTFTILPRVRPEVAFAVPEKLGGNSTANQNRVVSILAQENAELAKVYSRKDRALWREAFGWPLHSSSSLVVTDPYGYTRLTGQNTVTHKGTDFRAEKGTPVYAINRGVVRIAKEYTVYGKTVIIDHGLGLTSLYMHLSKLAVSRGKLVEKGDLLGYSGDTGYAEAAHLHLSIKIGGVSIDPMKFFNLFGL